MKHSNQTSQIMNKSICFDLCLIALNFTRVFGDTLTIDNATGQPTKSALTKFNLDFRGGTPADLVKAIEKESGNPLNAIIPTEDVNIELPPLKMNNVVTP